MYHGNVSFKAKEDLMSPHASKLSHIPGEEQSLLHRVCNVSTLSFLEIADRGIGEKRFPIQHWGREPSCGPHLRIASLLVSLLPHLSLFEGPLNLILTRRKGLFRSHHPLSFCISFPLQLCCLRGQGRWRSGNPSLGWSGKLGLGSLPSASLPGYDSIKSSKLDFGLCCIPISSINGENGGPRLGFETSGDNIWLKTSNSSLELATSTTSSSCILGG